MKRGYLQNAEKAARRPFNAHPKKVGSIMGFIRTILGLVVLLVIVVFGYWLYASYVSAPNAPYWAEINGYMPEPLRKFSCDKIRDRQPAGSVPTCDAT